MTGGWFVVEDEQGTHWLRQRREERLLNFIFVCPFCGLSWPIGSGLDCTCAGGNWVIEPGEGGWS